MTKPLRSNLFSDLVLSKTPRAGSRPAIRVGQVAFSYLDLRRGVEVLAHALRGHGVRKGDRIVLMIRNSPEYIVAFLAATALGCIAVPLDADAGSERLKHVLKTTTPACCLHLFGEAPPALRTPHLGLRMDPGSKKMEILAGMTIEDVADAPLPEIDGGLPAAILFSAGSTGCPKGVVLTHGHFLATARTLSAILGMTASHRDLILCPMTHSGAWQRVSSTLLSGGCVVIPDGLLSVPRVLEDIAAHGITGFFTTPPLLRYMLKTDPRKIRDRAASCRSIEIASAPLTPDELTRLMALFPETRILYQYGLTECSRALILDARVHPDKLHTVGRPTPAVQVAIAAEDGHLLGPDQTGEILLRAKQRTDGYWNLPDLNRARFRDGWFCTGDIGRMDSDGFVTYLGRRDDMINCGGVSYFPKEVEMELGDIHGIREYLIAGVEDPRGVLHHVPWVFVVPFDRDTWSASAFLASLRGKLPAHMIPRNVVVLPELPMTATGKPNRMLTVALHGPGRSTSSSA